MASGGGGSGGGYDEGMEVVVVGGGGGAVGSGEGGAEGGEDPDIHPNLIPGSTAAVWRGKHPNHRFKNKDFEAIEELYTDQNPLEPYIILVRPGPGPNQATIINSPRPDCFEAGRTLRGTWIRLDVPDTAQIHVTFLTAQMESLEAVVRDPCGCTNYKLSLLCHRIINFRMDLEFHMKKYDTPLTDAMPQTIKLTNFFKRCLALGNVKLSKYSHFPWHRLGLVDRGEDNYVILPEKDDDDEEEEEPEEENDSDYEDVDSDEEETGPIKMDPLQEDEEGIINDSRIPDNIRIVKESSKILELILHPDPRFQNEGIRFALFTSIYLPSASTLPIPAFHFKLSDIFETEKWRKNAGKGEEWPHPMSCEDILHLTHSCLNWFKYHLIVKDAPATRPDFLPADRAEIIKEALHMAMMIMIQFFIPEVEAMKPFVNGDSKPSPMCEEGANLFSACLNLCPWKGTDTAGYLHEYGMVVDNLHETDLVFGNLPSASLLPLGLMFQLGLASPSTVPYAFYGISLDVLNTYAATLVGRMGLKLRRPLKHYLHDYNLQPHVGMIYALVTILERTAEEAGEPRMYIDYAGSDLLTKGFDIMEHMYGAYPAHFLNSVIPILDMATTIVNRLVSKRYQQEMAKVHSESKEHPVYRTAFYRCFIGVQHGIRTIEVVVAEGGDVAFMNIPNVLQKILDLGKNLDRIGIPAMAAGYIDCLSEIGPAIAALVTESMLREVIKRLVRYRYEVPNPKKCPVELAAKAGRAMGKLVSIPTLVMNERLLAYVFEEGFINLNTDAVGCQPVSVKNNWSWALAELAQCIQICCTEHNFRPSNALLKNVVAYLERVNTGLPKSRYNGFRATGNLLAVIRPLNGNKRQAPERALIMRRCAGLITNLVESLGVGPEYKNRWNAAFGLGCIFENEELVAYIKTVATSNGTRNLLNKVTDALSMWARKSQNFKERIQCLISLRRIPTREMIGPNLELVLSRLCQSIVAYPTDESEMKNKFEVEMVVTLSSLWTLTAPADYEVLATTLRPFLDSLRTLFGKVGTKIVGDNVDVVVKGRDRLTSIRHQLNSGSEVMNLVIFLLGTLLGAEETRINDSLGEEAEANGNEAEDEEDEEEEDESDEEEDSSVEALDENLHRFHFA